MTCKQPITTKLASTVLFSMFAMLSTATFARTNEQLSIMESSQHIIVFKCLSVFAVIATLTFMLLSKRQLSSKRSVYAGGLLIIYGLLLASVWFVNYMVIGMGLIALSGVVIAFENGIGKLVYIVGVLFISVFASIEFGALSREFFNTIAFLYLLGVGLLFFVPDEMVSANLPYENDQPVNEVLLAKRLHNDAKIRDKAEHAKAINVKKAETLIMWACGISIFLTLIVVALRLDS